RVHKLFFLKDREFIVPVDPEDRIGKEGGQQQRKDQVAVIQLVEHVGDMHLVIVLLRTEIVAEHQGYQRDQIGQYQLQVLLFEADNKGHNKKVREIEKVFSRFDPLHIVHDREVKVEVQHREDPGQQILPPEVKMIGDNEEIG